MSTIVRLHAIEGDGGQDAERAIDRAFAWFHEVESRCTRFDPESELMRLSAHPGAAVPVSAILFEAVQFAVALAEATGGAFDPTVGLAMEAHGFSRNYRTGRSVRATSAASGASGAKATIACANAAPAGAAALSYHDLALDRVACTVTLRQPLVLDLGAIAKGLAIDLAARELHGLAGFAIDAGGDLFLGGANADGRPWSVGIRDPRDPGTLLDVVHVSDTAVCTSGGYERTSDDGRAHHILDARTRRSARAASGVTVLASTAMVADGLATAAFILGPDEGLALLERQGVEGLIVAADGTRRATAGFPHV